jgi:hypothetical protein
MFGDKLRQRVARPRLRGRLAFLPPGFRAISGHAEA